MCTPFLLSIDVNFLTRDELRGICSHMICDRVSCTDSQFEHHSDASWQDSNTRSGPPKLCLRLSIKLRQWVLACFFNSGICSSSVPAFSWVAAFDGAVSSKRFSTCRASAVTCLFPHRSKALTPLSGCRKICTWDSTKPSSTASWCSGGFPLPSYALHTSILEPAHDLALDRSRDTSRGRYFTKWEQTQVLFPAVLSNKQGEIVQLGSMLMWAEVC